MQYVTSIGCGLLVCNGNGHKLTKAICNIYWMDFSFAMKWESMDKSIGWKLFFCIENGHKWTNAICNIYWMDTLFAMEMGINGQMQYVTFIGWRLFLQ